MKNKIKRLLKEAGCSAATLGDCTGKLTWAHIISRKNRMLKWSLDNSLGLCEKHRVWFNEQGERRWHEFVAYYYPEKYQSVMKNNG